MANQLDEITGQVNGQGQDVRVINRQLPVTVGFGSILFEIALWVTIPILVLIFVLVSGVQESGLIIALGCILGILPGIIFIFMKIKAKNYFQQLE